MQQSLIDPELFGYAQCPVCLCKLPLEASMHQANLKQHCLICEQSKFVVPFKNCYTQCSMGHFFEQVDSHIHTICEQVNASQIPNKAFYIDIISDWTIFYGPVIYTHADNIYLKKKFCSLSSPDWHAGIEEALLFRDNLSKSFHAAVDKYTHALAYSLPPLKSSSSFSSGQEQSEPCQVNSTDLSTNVKSKPKPYQIPTSQHHSLLKNNIGFEHYRRTLPPPPLNNFSPSTASNSNNLAPTEQPILNNLLGNGQNSLFTNN